MFLAELLHSSALQRFLDSKSYEMKTGGDYTMNAPTRLRVTQGQIQSAKEVDILDLTEQHTQLRKISANEYEGPCPKCGGDDRFHVHRGKGWFFCRKCHLEKGDAIEFVQWMRAMPFPEAVEQLTGLLPALPVAHRQPAQRPAQRQPTVSPEDFGARAGPN